MNTNSIDSLTRRHFVLGTASVASGLAIGLCLESKTAMAQNAPLDPEIGAWVVIQPDDQVLIRMVKAEMGQGTMTGLSQLVAEELECDWSKVKVIFPTPGESVKRKGIWGNFFTGGSQGIRTSQIMVRNGGAAARMMLLEAAAQRWGVSVGECTALNSVVSHLPSARKTSFGSLAKDAARLPVPTQIALKDPKQWRIAGKPIKRLDSRQKVNGSLKYGIDLTFPNMLVATIKSCPVFGGKLKSFDASAVVNFDGVFKVVQVGDTAVAVIASNFWQAKKALNKIKIVWDEGPNAQVSSASIREIQLKGLSQDNLIIGHQIADAKSAINASNKTIESEYFLPFLNHATMEPMNATAIWTPDRCEAWVPTQNAEVSLNFLVAVSGLTIDKCDVHPLLLGGGFGRRLFNQEYVTQSVLLAKQVPGRHVKLIWTREEDMTQGQYHPSMMCKLVAALNEDKKLTSLHMKISGPSVAQSLNPQIHAKQNGIDPGVFNGLQQYGESPLSAYSPVTAQNALGYGFPNLLIEHYSYKTHIPLGIWRGVYANQNAIFMECFMDELAQAAGMDALEFRRQHMGERPRHLAVLNAAAKGIDWNSKPPKGVHRGIAQIMCFNSYVAAACELSVTTSKEVKIHRIVAAIDPGVAVNPAQIERQVAGSFVYGLSALFEQECTVKNGRIEQTNFDEFDSMRLSQMPKVETFILQGGGNVWGGIGEPTIAVGAPAVLNAMYRATGQRIRSAPLKNLGFKLV